MKTKLSIQQRLILPILLLGAVALISNLLSVFSINNVNSNASKIVDNYMVGSETLQVIRYATANIHKMALSHIVATDYNTMITVVTQIKEEEEALESYLEEYKNISQRMRKRSIPSLYPTMSLSSTLWSIWCAPAQTARLRMPTHTQTAT